MARQRGDGKNFMRGRILHTHATATKHDVVRRRTLGLAETIMYND